VSTSQIFGFDKEQCKGDHQHINYDELSYEFRSVDQLVEDFNAAGEEQAIKSKVMRLLTLYK
jgi:hypothetical protein